MKLRNRKGLVNNLPEGTAPVRRGPQVTRWIYFSLLFLAFGYLVYVALQNLFYVEVRGQVEVDKTQVSPTRSGQLNGLRWKEGMRVAAGSVLARVEPDNSCSALDADPRLAKLDYDIRLLDGRLTLQRAQLRGLRDERGQYDLRRALEMDGSRLRDMNSLSRDIDKLKLDIRLAEEELMLKRDTFAQISATPQIERPDCQVELLRAPFDAQVITVHYRDFEYANRGAPVVTLEALDAAVRIEAYADSRQYSRWQAGDPVQLRFPDHSESEGLIEAVQSAAYNTPARQWDEYVPVEARLRIHLRAATPEAAAHWRRFDRMDVTVRMYR